MVLLLKIHGVPAAVPAVEEAVPVRIPAAVKHRLHHRCRSTNAISTAQKDRKLLLVLELEGLVKESERDRLQLYSDCDFLMQIKQSAGVYLEDFLLMIEGREKQCRKNDTVNPSIHGAEVFSSPKIARLCTDLFSPWISV